MKTFKMHGLQIHEFLCFHITHLKTSINQKVISYLTEIMILILKVLHIWPIKKVNIRLHIYYYNTAYKNIWNQLKVKLINPTSSLPCFLRRLKPWSRENEPNRESWQGGGGGGASQSQVFFDTVILVLCSFGLDFYACMGHSQ